LQQQMRPTFAPPHLLPLAEPFAHDLVDGRLHKPCGNRLAVAMPFETREAHFVSIKRSSGATDSGSKVVSGRNEVALRR
jgi:hypothetical protein